MKDLLAARKSAGLRQSDLAEITGLDQSLISKWESGQKSMTEPMAERLARHLPDTDPRVLVFSNKCTTFKRAQQDGDRVGVLKAAEAIVKHAEQLPENPEVDAMLDRLVSVAVKFTEGDLDPQEYGVVEDEGRDLLGRKVEKSKAKADTGLYPLHPGHRNTPFMADKAGGDGGEEDDDFDDGRDAYGLRVAPLEQTSKKSRPDGIFEDLEEDFEDDQLTGLESESEEYDDLDDGRDQYGIRIRPL